MANLACNVEEPEEQLYLLEVIINDVVILREGILETLAEEPYSVIQDDEISVRRDSKEELQLLENKEKIFKKRVDNKNSLRVVLQFADFPVIEVPENEFGAEQPDESRPTKGKSCLIPMVPKQMMEVIRKHSVQLQVLRDAKLGTSRVIGITRFNLGQDFIDAVAMANTPTILPVSTFIEGEYDAYNVFGEVTASVHILLRLSCFGSTIFSQLKNITDTSCRYAEGYVNSGAKQSKPKKSNPPYLSRADFGHVDFGIKSANLLQDCHLNPTDIPWRKLHEDPVDPRFCGSARLFKEQWSSKGEQPSRVVPLSPTSSALERSLCLGGICCEGQANSSQVIVPPEFGSHLPGSIQDLLPSRKPTVYQPDLLSRSFESGYSRKPDQTGRVDWSQSAQCIGACPGSGACQRLCTASTASQPPVERVMRPGPNKCPPVEEYSPPLKSSPNVPGNVRRDMKIIPCPNNPDSRPTSTGNTDCGLRIHIDQREQNLHGLQPPLLAPEFALGGMAWPPLCSCPKVSTRNVESSLGAVCCECSNILASLKPVELPYMSSPPCTQHSIGSSGTGLPPVPIRLPPPQPDCPLAELLREGQNKSTLPPVGAIKAEEQPQDITLGNKPDEKPTVEEQTTFNTEPKGQGLKSSEKAEEPAKVQKARRKKSKEGITTTLDEEATGVTPTAKEYSEGGKRSLGPSTAYVSETDTDEVPPKRKKIVKKIVGRGSATPTRLIEPKEQDLRIHYTPTAGLYPGNVVGHRNCIPIISRVPKRMGWLWNVQGADGFLKPGRGWRPGSIQTNVMKVMDITKTPGKPSSKSSSAGKIQGIVKARSVDQHPKKVETIRQLTAQDGDAPAPSPIDLVPTLHVHKKNGLHFVSMVPPPKEHARNGKMFDRGDMGNHLSGSEDNLPVQFRIDTKTPNSFPMGHNLYETDETSTNSEDSYQMDIIAPSTLQHHQPRVQTHDMQVQVMDDHFVEAAIEGKSKKKKSIRKNTFDKNGKGKRPAKRSLKKM